MDQNNEKLKYLTEPFFLTDSRFEVNYKHNLERKSMKLNLIRKSMKLYFSELGNILFKNFTIIWDFTAFRAINSNEMARFLVWLKKSQKCHRNHMFIVKYHLGYLKFRLILVIFLLDQSWFPKRCHFLAIYLSESCKIPDDSKILEKNVA